MKVGLYGDHGLKLMGLILSELNYNRIEVDNSGLCLCEYPNGDDLAPIAVCFPSEEKGCLEQIRTLIEENPSKNFYVFETRTNEHKIGKRQEIIGDHPNLKYIQVGVADICESNFPEALNEIIQNCKE